MTAHDLAADWDLLNGFDGFRVAGVPGTFTRTVWDRAQYVPRSKRVQLSRIDAGLAVCVRYVEPETEVQLVRGKR